MDFLIAVGFVSDVNSEMVVPGNALPNSAAVLVLPVRPLRNLFEPQAAQLWLMPWQTRQRYSPFSFSHHLQRARVIHDDLEPSSLISTDQSSISFQRKCLEAS